MADPTAGDVLQASLAVDSLHVEKALCSKEELAPSRLGFPSEFPFEFDSPSFSSAFTSPGDSTETEEESSDDEEDFLAGLTRRLALSTQRLPSPTFANDKTEEKRQIVSTSPQSTLSGLGSWSASGSGSPNGPSSQVPSPPMTPFRNDDAWDVISAAAGEVARLKMGGEQLLSNRPSPNPNSLLHHHHAKPQHGAFCSDLGFQQFYNHSSQTGHVQRNECEAKQKIYSDWLLQSKASYYQSQLTLKSLEQQFPRKVTGVTGCENGRGVRPVTWLRSAPSQQQACSAVRSVFPVASAAKKPCSGTGVFIPRRYTNPSDSHRSSGGSGVVHLSKVVHPQNLNFVEFNDLTKPHSRPSLSGHNHFDYGNCPEPAMARRSGFSIRQGGLRPVAGGCLNQERPLLPQEWMY